MCIIAAVAGAAAYWIELIGSLSAGLAMTSFTPIHVGRGLKVTFVPNCYAGG